MLLRRVARTVPGGQPVPDGTGVELRLHADDSLVATTTVAGGQYVFQRNGNPGPHYTTLTHDATTQIISSKAVGVSGTTDVGNIPLFMRSWDDGYVAGVLNLLAVTATGTSMNVTVAAGAAIVRGLLYDQYQALPFTIAAPAAQPRIDRVVVEVVPSGGGENIEGRARIVVKPGTPAASPAAPALVQTATLWETSLATVYVDPAVQVIAANKVTSTRVAATPVILPGAITETMLASPSVTTAKLAANAVTEPAIVDGAVTTLKIAALAVTGGRIGTRQISGGKLVLATVTEAELADGAVTKAKLAADAKQAAFMPGTEYVATGSLGAGVTRNLVTMAVGPLVSGTVYDISCTNFCTLRGTGSTGTVSLRCSIAGGTLRTQEFQHTGGVPRGAQVTQSATVTGTGVTINVIGSIQYETGDACDVRAGQITAIAIPR